MLGRFWCYAWGHAVHNGTFARTGRACTRCGKALLADDGECVRVGHTLSCFLRHHTYEEVVKRHGHTEYACIRCGHPLLFESYRDPYAGGGIFAKKVRYLCGLFGHHVHAVTERDGGTEYACHCGHTFVQQPKQRDVVRHPLACVLLGHWISFVEVRGVFSEYACRTCGHPFLFKGKGGSSSPLPRVRYYAPPRRMSAPSASKAPTPIH
jgi:DNA-directed RNA polymerase subunit RPC12/RpoP